MPSPPSAPSLGGAAYALLERGLRVYGVDPTPPGRKHAPVVAEHPRFVEIVARLGEPGLLQRLPSDVDWLLCDANIAPDVAVPHLADLCSRCGERLQGLFYTCKLGEKLWTKPAQMLDELEALKAQLAAAADFGLMQSVQLSNNRQELLVLGVTRRGLQRAEGRRLPVWSEIEDVGRAVTQLFARTHTVCALLRYGQGHRTARESRRDMRRDDACRTVP